MASNKTYRSIATELSSFAIDRLKTKAILLYYNTRREILGKSSAEKKKFS